MRRKLSFAAAVLTVTLCAGQLTAMADVIPGGEIAGIPAEETEDGTDEFPVDENGEYTIIEGVGRVTVTQKFFDSENEGVETYSVKKDGNTYLSDNFQVKEFACKDGADEVLIDRRLVEVLQQIRDHFGAPVTITSGYRTPSHNRAVGGASNSYHMYGMAADIKVSGQTPREVAAYAESIGVKGIGLYTSWVHVDTRRKSYSYFWNSVSEETYEVASFAGANGAGGQAGDVDEDGYLTANDSLCVLKHVVGLIDLEGNSRDCADMNGDGRIDSVDSLMILEAIVNGR